MNGNIVGNIIVVVNFIIGIGELILIGIKVVDFVVDFM